MNEENSPIDQSWINNQDRPAPAPAPAPAPVKIIKPKRNWWKTSLAIIATFSLSSLIMYLVISGPSLWEKLNYRINPDPVNTNLELTDLPPPPSLNTDQTTSTADNNSDRRAVAPAITASIAGLQITQNQIFIPRINLRAPVVWNSSSDPEIALENLQKGVVHYGFTALPNETGNVFIFGHSSYYWWDPGQYKRAFALLDQMQNGDQIYIGFNDQIYIYEVFNEVVVNPSDVSVTDSTDEPRLSLMTCVPVGTAANRLINQSRLISVLSADGRFAEPLPNEASAIGIAPIKLLPSI